MKLNNSSQRNRLRDENFLENKKQGKSKYRSAAVLQAILTSDDGQYRPKHVVYRRQSEDDAQLVIKVLKFVLYFII
jgi:hypothetical protein